MRETVVSELRSPQRPARARACAGSWDGTGVSSIASRQSREGEQAEPELIELLLLDPDSDPFLFLYLPFLSFL